ncbi:ABC transporter substrate-binding protein [Aromatoleum bremense]|uniref:Peptide ABC transporter substrate-binding protein n=1 Tax=Aromatoleum bremense TaxID=76115 RepID=A0ABX1NUF2_9RHOO|nr:ABC transporter substrate-binding protein [Aromatoleum bremense]NMG15393.1 peptide ABC transporter substrate-binding protein [Aromatoleum bremense]QTQ34071.1 Putative ABC transporter, periplasmic binding protein [Aromatoleum bremense]
MFSRACLLLLSCVLLAACGQVWNDPYPVAERDQNVMYTAFTDRPKHLDPVQSYSEDEAAFLYQIYEPPLQYHYLERPYTLIPGSAAQLPVVRRYDARGRELPADAPAGRVDRSEYEIRIAPGILYQPHPAFAKADDGSPRYLELDPDELEGVRDLGDFPETGTRELEAGDFVHQIKRLAHPRLHSPIFELMAEYIPGLKVLQKRLADEAQRNPGWIDLTAHALPGVEVVDRHTYRITLKGAYPQFLYWLSMPFFAPVPPEADRFFGQPGMAERNLTLDWWPIGTGPFMLAENNPNARMVLVRNPNYRGDPYPCEGDPADRDAGLLADCGKPMPFLDKVVFSREREGIPYWNKFLQGYYDASGVSSENFDQAVNMSSQGEVVLSDDMVERGIELLTSVSPSVFYLGFNMLDPVVGGGDTAAGRERARKLRQAISIALDMEEFVSIFLNGRGVPAMHPIPPGIFGARDGEAGINPVVYEWRDGKAVRRSKDVARRLLAEAGYPDGRDAKTGEPLIINLDTTPGGLGDKARSDWLAKQFRELGVQFVVRPTDYNRFQDKIREGNAQLFFFGWNADYPDPENMLFLLHGPQAKVRESGQNAANYQNGEYDRLFEQMKGMPDGPERQKIIDRMVAILQHDAPWIFGFHPKAYSLQHGWVKNRKPGSMIRNTLKYQRVDLERRQALRAQWNQPVVWPLGLVALLFVVIVAPAFLHYRRRERATGVGGVA